MPAAGLIAPDLTADDLNIYAEATCGNIEFFGFALELLGLCNPATDKLIVNGTAMEKAAEAQGHLKSVRLNLPAGFDMTGRNAIVIVNLYPIFEKTF